MQRIALGLRYDGTHYHGWQTQEGLKTVQHAVENAVSHVADHPVIVTTAGRTDAGVHATAQVIHFDTTAIRTEHAWVFGVNGNLSHDISVTWAKPVAANFHARFSATSRTYRYIIYNHSIRPGILRKAVGWYYRPLDEKRMHESALYLVGEHDFSSFRGSGCQATHPIRKINYIKVSRVKDMVVIEVQANAFLLHMVRNIVGSLIAVGSGEKPIHWIKEVLLARDRRHSGVTMAPRGLYLVAIDYPDEFAIPQTEVGPFFLT